MLIRAPRPRSATMSVTMRKSQVLGMMLWRGGLMLAAGYSLYEAARWVLRFFDIPDQLQVGLGLAIAGAVLVLASLLVERVIDARAEGNLIE